MLYGIFSGVYGNTDRLEKTINRFRVIGTDAEVCLGDLFSKQFDPDLKKRSRELGIYAIRGVNEHYIDKEAGIPISKLFDGINISGVKFIGCGSNQEQQIAPKRQLIVEYGDKNLIDNIPISRNLFDSGLYQITLESRITLKMEQLATIERQTLRLLTDVLIVEDTPKYVRSLKEELSKCELSSKAVRTLEEGIDIALNEAPQVIIVDGNLLLSCHGIDLVKVVRNTTGNYSRIIAAYGDRNVDHADWQKAGADVCFSKPYNAETIVSIAKEFCS